MFALIASRTINSTDAFYHPSSLASRKDLGLTNNFLFGRELLHSNDFGGMSGADPGEPFFRRLTQQAGIQRTCRAK